MVLHRNIATLVGYRCLSSTFFLFNKHRTASIKFLAVSGAPLCECEMVIELHKYFHDDRSPNGNNLDRVRLDGVWTGKWAIRVSEQKGDDWKRIKFWCYLLINSIKECTINYGVIWYRWPKIIIYVFWFWYGLSYSFYRIFGQFFLNRNISLIEHENLTSVESQEQINCLLR